MVLRVVFVIWDIDILHLLYDRFEMKTTFLIFVYSFLYYFKPANIWYVYSVAGRILKFVIVCTEKIEKQKQKLTIFPYIGIRRGADFCRKRKTISILT